MSYDRYSANIRPIDLLRGVVTRPGILSVLSRLDLLGKRSVGNSTLIMGGTGVGAGLTLLHTHFRSATKAALLIFNRDTAMSTVLKNVPEAVQEHPNWKSHCEYDHETGFRYAFTYRDDPGKMITLTVLVFNVPGLNVKRDGGAHLKSWNQLSLSGQNV